MFLAGVGTAKPQLRCGRTAQTSSSQPLIQLSYKSYKQRSDALSGLAVVMMVVVFDTKYLLVESIVRFHDFCARTAAAFF